MADRFYGYQYGTSPRKLNSEYTPYKNRYSQKDEPVSNNRSRSQSSKNTKSPSSTRRTNRVRSNTQERVNSDYERKQVRDNDIEARETYSQRNVVVTKANVKTRLKIVMFLIAGFSVLFAISYQNSLINESFNRKEQYKKEMEALSKTNQQIEVNIENNLNLNNIEQAAKEKLGMQKLSNEQKIYVSLPKEDYVQPAAEQIVVEEDVGFFERLHRWFTGQ